MNLAIVTATSKEDCAKLINHLIARGICRPIEGRTEPIPMYKPEEDWDYSTMLHYRALEIIPGKERFVSESHSL